MTSSHIGQYKIGYEWKKIRLLGQIRSKEKTDWLTCFMDKMYILNQCGLSILGIERKKFGL